MGKFFKKIYSFAYYRVAAGEVMTVLYSLCLHVHYSFREKKPGKDKETLEYFLVKHCHIVEKGLALPAPRKGFGQPKIEMLIKRTHQYEKKYGESQVGLMVRDTLREYLLFHKDDLNIFTSAYLESLRNFVSEKPRKEKGG